MGEYDKHLQRKQGKFKKERVPMPLFELGQTVGTQGALQALIEAQQPPDELLNRHQTRVWGDLCDEDKQENELSVENGFRIFSAYELKTGVKLWVITEWDRSVTTGTLPRSIEKKQELVSFLACCRAIIANQPQFEEFQCCQTGIRSRRLEQN